MTFRQLAGTLRRAVPTALRLVSDAMAAPACKPYPVHLCRAVRVVYDVTPFIDIASQIRPKSLL